MKSCVLKWIRTQSLPFGSLGAQTQVRAHPGTLPVLLTHSKKIRNLDFTYLHLSRQGA